MIVARIERHFINNAHAMFQICDDLCYKSKNVYNFANYMIRQEFISTKKIPKITTDLDKKIQKEEVYKELGSQASQRVLFQLNKNWKSFLVAIKDYHKNPSKYLGMPRLPKYKDKNGRNLVQLKNIQFRVEDGYVYFSWNVLKPFNNLIKTNVQGKLQQLRIVPKGNCYVLEIVYEKEITPQELDITRIAAIDLGLNNFVTMVNNIGEKPIVINGKGIKSYNQYWNKVTGKYRSEAKSVNKLDWTNRLARMTTKRNNKMDYFMHCASRFVVDYCAMNNIGTLVVGKNNGWKQECDMGKVNNQKFTQIPYELFLNKLQYKCEEIGIELILTEENYTSGTSFIDGELPKKENYNKARRTHRGLFTSNKGIKINADVNGAYQIMKKVFPNEFSNGIEGVDLHPVVINL